MRSLTVAVDIDEVVARMHEPWVRWGNNRFGTSYDPSFGFPTWNAPSEWWGEEGMEFIAPWAYDADVITSYPGADRMLDYMRHNGHRITFVTHCINGTEDAKRRWARRWGILTKCDGWINTEKKIDIVADVLVDDAEHHIRSWVASGRWALLMSRPHNQDCDVGRRVYDLKQVVEIIGTRPRIALA